jgi:hypothetical protein
LDSVYAGIDSTFVYGRLDFAGTVPDMEFDLVVNLESWANGEARPRRTLRLDGKVQDRNLTRWKVDGLEETSSAGSGVSSTQVEEIARAALVRNFEFRLPLSWLLAVPSSATPQTEADHKADAAAIAPTSRLRLRFSLWHNRLPVDALPTEGWIELQLLSEAELHSI